MNVSISRVILLIYFIFVWFFLFFYQHFIEDLHVNGLIYWISSDAPVYYNSAEIYSIEDFLENPHYFLNLMPVFIYNMVGGLLNYLIFVSILGFFIFFYSLEFIDKRFRVIYLIVLIIFPYTSLTYFSINKEIFAFLSAILLACYYNKQVVYILFFSLVLAFFARSYLLLTYVLMLFLFPVNGSRKPRWNFLLLFFLCISIVPFLISSFVGFGTKDLIQSDAGGAAIYFSSLILNGWYIAIYFAKYIILMLSKGYQGFNVGFDFSGRLQDAHEFFVSLLSSLFFIAAISRHLLAKYSIKENKNDSRFLYLALFSPIILLFSDIFHWRYSSFVFVFLLFYFFSSARIEKRSLKAL